MEEKNHMIELVTQERDELARENQVRLRKQCHLTLCFRCLFIQHLFICQNLSGDLEELRRALANIQSAPPAESLYMRPDDITAAGNLETPGQADHVYDSIGK